MKKLIILFLNLLNKKKFNFFYFFNYFFVFFIVSINHNVYSLEITVPLKIYENLSKTISNPIIGSTNVIIKKGVILNNNARSNNAKLSGFFTSLPLVFCWT